MPPTTADLPRFFAYRDVLEILFDGSEAAFADAWVHGTLSAPVRAACLESMSPRYLEVLLLARMNRQLDALAALLQQGDLTVFEDPPQATRQ